MKLSVSMFPSPTDLLSSGNTPRISSKSSLSLVVAIKSANALSSSFENSGNTHLISSNESEVLRVSFKSLIDWI